MSAARLSGLDRRARSEQRVKKFTENFARFGWSGAIKPCRRVRRDGVALQTVWYVIALCCVLTIMYLQWLLPWLKGLIG